MDDYVPYGPGWEKEMMKWDKKSLIKLLGETLDKINQSENVKCWGEHILTLNSKEDWINKIPYRLPEEHHHKMLLWIDKKGFLLKTGQDFEAAKKLDHYPVRVYRGILTSDRLSDIETGETMFNEIFPVTNS